jgi:uncharacterized glyoxalase superfamily protein PhnB
MLEAESGGHQFHRERTMQLNPYLMFNGRCEEAFNSYQKILGGEIVAMIPHEGTPAEGGVPPEWRKRSSTHDWLAMAWC